MVRPAGGSAAGQAAARWDEEWRGHLESLPTPLTRLGWAAAILGYAAPRQARLLREGDRRQTERSFPVAELLVAVAGTLIGMLVIGRQSIALIENHQLNVHLQPRCSSSPRRSSSSRTTFVASRVTSDHL